MVGIDVFGGREVVVGRARETVVVDWRRGKVVGNLGRLGLEVDMLVLRRWGVGRLRCRSVVDRN